MGEVTTMPGRARLTALQEFEEAADQIIMDYASASRAKGQSHYERPLGTFKRESYKLLRRVIAEQGQHKVIKNVVRSWGVEPARLDYAENRYHFGLLAIDPQSDVLDRKRLSLWSRQMTYADLHGVPDRYLLGFLWQSGSPSQISRKLKEGYREPWFGR